MFCWVMWLELFGVIVASCVLPWMTIGLPHVYIFVLSLLIILIKFCCLTSFLLLLIVVGRVLGLCELVWLHISWTMLDLIDRFDRPVNLRMMRKLLVLMYRLRTVVGTSHVVLLTDIQALFEERRSD